MAKVKKSEQNMTLLDHLIELRNRLLISFCAFVVLFCLCFIKFTNNNQNLADIVYIFLQAPLASQMLESGGRMIYTALHEGFFTQVKVAFFISLCISLPVFLIQICKPSSNRLTSPRNLFIKKPLINSSSSGSSSTCVPTN